MHKLKDSPSKVNLIWYWISLKHLYVYSIKSTKLKVVLKQEKIKKLYRIKHTIILLSYNNNIMYTSILIVLVVHISSSSK